MIHMLHFSTNLLATLELILHQINHSNFYKLNIDSISMYLVLTVIQKERKKVAQ